MNMSPKDMDSDFLLMEIKAGGAQVERKWVMTGKKVNRCCVVRETMEGGPAVMASINCLPP